jgi:hypothetical protein
MNDNKEVLSTLLAEIPNIISCKKGDIHFDHVWAISCPWGTKQKKIEESNV